jgi:hypothetical protein
MLVSALMERVPKDGAIEQKGERPWMVRLHPSL